mmetsp:Transcript_1886/g.2349  ORF Transcript_1886/g.2349 Transcript_1886/m.2349 type:complete len:132 (+) Transcript_1886:1710-2105(+)
MGHTNIVLPFLTNNYVDFPANEAEKWNPKKTVPFCTLRNEPYLLNHCSEWAISKFNDHFIIGMRDIKVFLETTLPQIDLAFGQVQSLINHLEWIVEHNGFITFKACLQFAVREYDKHFFKEIEMIRATNQK